MRILIDDINHTVEVYKYHEIEGQQIEVSKKYVRRQPELSHTDDEVTIKFHPRLGARVSVQVDDDVFEATVERDYGAQDVLAVIGSQINRDDTDRHAVLGAGDDEVYTLTVTGGKVEHAEAEDLEHEPLPADVEEALHRHIAGYKG